MDSSPERAELEGAFPALKETSYAITSPQSRRYNCIAWAMGRDDVWVCPDDPSISSWPDGIPREQTRAAFIVAFESIGYEVCDSADFESQFERVAVFELDGQPAHAARQLPDGAWTSKCGKDVDILHDLQALEGSLYGVVAVILRRKRIAAPDD